MAVPARIRDGGRMRGMVLLAVLAGSFILLLALTPRAEAFVYWSNMTGESIGRANNNGTGVNQNFITGAGYPRDIVVDDYHIYWTTGSSIARASLDGTNMNLGFITGCWAPDGLAIYNDHILWADYSGYIGRATTSGTGIDRTWINCKAAPSNLTQHAGYFYWSWYPAGQDVPYIARDNPPTADGDTVSHTNILGDYWVHDIEGMCATGSYLYWRSDDAIGRASTPYGLNPDRNHITGLEGWGSGLAVHDDHLYYTTTALAQGPANIGRVGTDGSGLNNAFITGCSTPEGVAADDHTGPTRLMAVADEISAADLPANLATPLVQKLRNAKAAADRGQPKAARNIVNATIKEIGAQAGKKIPADTAERWITALRLLKVHIV